MRGEIKEQGEGDAGTSATTSDTEVARNPHQPEGWRRDGIDFFVPPPPRCTQTSRRRLFANSTPSRSPQTSSYSWDETLTRTMHKFSTAATKSSDVLYAPPARPASAGAPDPQAGASGLLSASFHRYGGVRGERDGVEFAKPRRRDVCVHRGGGGTKKLMPSRRHPSGCWGLRATSVSLVVVDVPASTSPCSLISPRKPHQRTLPYL